MIRVVLCDDHAVVRRGIRDTLTEAPDIAITGEAGAIQNCAMFCATPRCDVLLLDLNMPGRNGLEVLASLRETESSIKVLVVSMNPEDQYAVRCLRAGAQGYASKASDPVALIDAVRTLAQGRKYLTPDVAQMLADSVSQPEQEAPIRPFRKESYKHLLKIASGKRLSEIADELMLSPKTVSVYRARVLEKLKLNNNAELTVYAIRNQLV